MTEEKDLYYDEQGFMVFTAKFLLGRGVCCGNDCKHCPYEHIHVTEKQDSTITRFNNRTGQSLEGITQADL